MTVTQSSTERPLDQRPSTAPVTDVDRPRPSTDPVSFADRVFEAVLGAQAVQAAYLGDRLGWYEALAEAGPLTSVQLAERTGTDERYAREWLEHQAAVAWVVVDDPGASPTARRFSLPAAHAEVLTDPDSQVYAAPFARFVGGLGLELGRIADAYRSGEGVSWAELGEDPREAQAAANRPLFLGPLGSEILPGIAEVDRLLRAGGRVADVGCGAGWSSIGVAESYPTATVDGVDLDEPSIEMARRHAAEAGVGDRVRFRAADAATLAAAGYDVVMAMECIHDLGDPVGVLAAMGRLAAPDGVVVVMDERVGDRFEGPADPVEQLYYGFSITCCLPDGRSHDHSAATGTVMRRETLEGYAVEAGFSSVEVLDVDHDMFRFYRLHR